MIRFGFVICGLAFSNELMSVPYCFANPDRVAPLGIVIEFAIIKITFYDIRQIEGLIDRLVWIRSKVRSG